MLTPLIHVECCVSPRVQPSLDHGNGLKPHSFPYNLLHMSQDMPMVVIFGRPGAGKTTVAEKVIDLLQRETCLQPLGLDLDVCVPRWMRDNFAAGIYPTLKERQEFAESACNYVDKCLGETKADGANTTLAAIVSFSFVNTDLRDIYRSRFRQTIWILLDTTEEEAERRIQEREGHFYNGKAECNDNKQKNRKASEGDNTDWEFAPVTFPHTVIDGNIPAETNAKRVVQLLKTTLSSD